MNSSRNLIGDLLVRAMDDWLYDAELLDLARVLGAHSAQDQRTVALGMVAEALLSGLMEAGTVDDNGFTSWTCSAADAVTRISDEWLSRDDPLVMPGEIMWLNNTALGIQRAQTAIDSKPV